MVQPVASAGKTLQAIWLIGQFHGVMRPQTPMGSLAISVAPRGFFEAEGLQRLDGGIQVRRPEPDLKAAGERGGRPHFFRDGRCKLPDSGLIFLQNACQDREPFLAPSLGPTGERPARRLHRPIGIGGRAKRDSSADLFRRGIHDIEGPEFVRVGPFSIYVKLERFAHELPSVCAAPLTRHNSSRRAHGLPSMIDALGSHLQSPDHGCHTEHQSCRDLHCLMYCMFSPFGETGTLKNYSARAANRRGPGWSLRARDSTRR